VKEEDSLDPEGKLLSELETMGESSEPETMGEEMAAASWQPARRQVVSNSPMLKCFFIPRLLYNKRKRSGNTDIFTIKLIMWTY
jgi:hypothetical protein